MSDVEKADESKESWQERWHRKQEEIRRAQPEVYRAVVIIIVAAAVYLGAAYIEPLKDAKIPFGEYIPFSFAYLQASVPCDETICQYGVHYDLAWVWITPGLMLALATAYFYKRWGVIFGHCLRWQGCTCLAVLLFNLFGFWTTPGCWKTHNPYTLTR